MKKLLLLVGVASLAACGSGASEEAEADAAAAEAAAPAEAAEAAANDGNSVQFGRFAMTVEGKEMGIATFREDGFFSQEEPDVLTLDGKWEMADDGKMCVTIDDSDSDPVCFDIGELNEDGSWSITAPNGETGVLVPIEEG